MKNLKGQFFTNETTPVETLAHGVHRWFSRQDVTGSEDLMMTRVDMNPGKGHSFHIHPTMDEVIYVLSGEAEQWIEQESRVLGPGEAAFIPKNKVHATFTKGDEPLSFLAILGPAAAPDEATVDVFDEEPWKSLKDS